MSIVRSKKKEVQLQQQVRVHKDANMINVRSFTNKLRGQFLRALKIDVLFDNFCARGNNTLWK